MSALAPTVEGHIPFEIPSIAHPCQTYYKIFGEPQAGSPTVIMLHGGPGAGHEYLLPFAALWPQYKLPVVFYDQIGCGASTRLPATAGDKSFWQESLFLSELENLIDGLGLRAGAGFHLVGQSWGARVAAAFAATRPAGLRRLVLASGVASTELAVEGLQLLRQELPTETRTALEAAERAGDFDGAPYRDAVAVFMRDRMCRVEKAPPEIAPALTHLAEDRTVYGTMYGPSGLTLNGSLLGWTCIPRLPRISAPCLVYNGEYDTSHEIATAPFFEHIPRVRWITFPNTAHMCHLDGETMRARVLQVVGEFLTQEDVS